MNIYRSSSSSSINYFILHVGDFNVADIDRLGYVLPAILPDPIKCAKYGELKHLMYRLSY